MPKVGFVTIGQSPRRDVMGDIAPLLSGIEVLEAGALDNLCGAELAGLAPAEGEGVLVSRLRDGSQVILSEEKVIPLLQGSVDALIAQGARLVALLCTGQFPDPKRAAPLLFPDRLLHHFVRAVLPEEGKLGVFVPLPEQEAAARERWGTVCADVRVVSASPYIGFEEGIQKADQLRDRALVVMDCIGYSQGHKEAVRRRVNCPVLLPRTLVARAVQELI